MKTQPDNVLPISTPADLICLVPYLLGFHPQHSVVIVAVRDHKVVVLARTDLPNPGSDPQTVRLRIGQLAAQVAANGATGAALIGYGPAEVVTPVIDTARQIFPSHAVQVREALRVADGRYFSYLCTDPGCCPTDGVPFDPSTSQAAAAATVAGMVALPDRQALAAWIAPIRGTARQAMRQATKAATARLLDLLEAATTGERRRQVVQCAGRQAVDNALDQQARGIAVDDEQAAWLCLLLTDIPVRDHAWTRTGTRESDLQLWADLTRRAEPHLVAAPASLCAFAAWRRGNGSLANIAVDRALSAKPGYRMAELIAELLASAVPPHAFDDWLSHTGDTTGTPVPAADAPNRAG